MLEEKLKTLNKIFEGKDIRTIWDSEKEEYYFSVVDIVEVLTNSPRPRKYWNALKIKLQEEGSELSSKLGQLKMEAPDGKMRLTDTLDMEGIFRLIQSIPSPKAEPFKLWLSKLGKGQVDNVFDPSMGIDKMIDFYLKKGYDLEWIEARVKAIINRKKLTKVWEDNGISENKEYAILTNEIYKTWSGMKASEYKDYKGIRKESLRDNMTDIEIALTDLGEIATRELAKKHKPGGLEENKEIAQLGGRAVKAARTDLEKSFGESVISPNNKIEGRYEKQLRGE